MSGLSSDRSSMWEISKLEMTDCTDCRDGAGEERRSQILGEAVLTCSEHVTPGEGGEVKGCACLCVSTWSCTESQDAELWSLTGKLSHHLREREGPNTSRLKDYI